jgi:hypothetical protein
VLPVISVVNSYGHPAAKLPWKQIKSFTVSAGNVVDPSQFAYGSPAANRLWKQMKSFTVSRGELVDPSQFA